MIHLKTFRKPFSFSGGSKKNIVNFEHISHFCSIVSIVNFEQVNAGWDFIGLYEKMYKNMWFLQRNIHILTDVVTGVVNYANPKLNKQ